MTVDGTAAAARLLSFGPINGGYCLYYVWQAYKAVGASTGRSAGTALEAWNLSDGKHPGDRNPPPGVPVFWGAKSSSSAGDVVISLGGGRVAATDYPVYGVVGTCSVDERERQIGRPYLGWTEAIFDARVYDPAPTPPPAPPTPKEQEDMMIYVATTDGPSGLVTAGNWYIQGSEGPLRRLSDLEIGAYVYWGNNGIPYRRADWQGVHIETVIRYVGYRHINGRFEDGLSGRIQGPGGQGAEYPQTISINPQMIDVDGLATALAGKLGIGVDQVRAAVRAELADLTLHAS